MTYLTHSRKERSSMALATSLHDRAGETIADGPDGLTARWVLVTPEIASRWLRRNIDNRHEKAPLQVRLRRHLERDEWDAGTAIRFGRSGRLLDGQNRLRAIEASGINAWVLVVEGSADATQATIDTGVSRKLGDLLTMRGEKHATTLAGALGLLYLYRRTDELGISDARSRPNHLEALALLEAEPAIRDSVQIGQGTVARLLQSPSLAGAMHYVCSEIDASDAAYYFDRLASGQGLVEGDPILTLRNDLVRDLAASRKMPSRRRSAIAIRAWNAYRSGEKLTKLQWSPGGARPDPYPVPR